MALQHPPGFPEPAWLPVIAAEAQARSTLLTALAKVGWQHAGGTRFLSWDTVKGLTLIYAETVVSVFAEEACRAAATGDLPISKLDTIIEGFADNVLHYAEHGIENEKLDATWGRSRHSSIRQELRPKLMGGSWHLKYLSEVQSIISSLTKPAFASSQIAENRRSIVQPLLDKKGLTASSWADKAGVDPSVVYGYLQGKSNPRPLSRTSLAEALGLPIDKFPD